MYILCVYVCVCVCIYKMQIYIHMKFHFLKFWMELVMEERANTVERRAQLFFFLIFLVLSVSIFRDISLTVLFC